MFKLERNQRVDRNCPNCKHAAKHHIIVAKMGMTVCKVIGCKCALTFNYSQKVLEEMK